MPDIVVVAVVVCLSEEEPLFFLPILYSFLGFYPFLGSRMYLKPGVIADLAMSTLSIV